MVAASVGGAVVAEKRSIHRYISTKSKQKTNN